MRISIAPASTKTGAAVIRSLLSHDDASLEIHAIYRSPAKAPPAFTQDSRFHSAKGDISDSSSLDFSGSDVVLTITPPLYEADDLVKQAGVVSKNVKEAVERSGSVKRLVLLSSGGAQHTEGVGEILCNNMAEQVFADTNVPEIIYVRCTFFMENWTACLDPLREPEPFFYSTITPLDFKSPMIAIKDIGSIIASELIKQPLPAQSPPSKPYIFEIHGPRNYSPQDVQAAFSSAMGKKVSIKPVEKHEFRSYFSKIFPPQTVDGWVEMSLSFLPGGILASDTADYDNKPIVKGRTELDEAIREAIEAGL